MTDVGGLGSMSLKLLHKQETMVTWFTADCCMRPTYIGVSLRVFKDKIFVHEKNTVVH